MSTSIYYIWNMRDNLPYNQYNRVAFTSKDEAENHLLDILYGGLLIDEDILKFQREWLTVVKGSSTMSAHSDVTYNDLYVSYLTS